MVDSELRWHPKITPYRLTVLTTTISLGTAKAVSTQMGSAMMPTTFEWVSGTVVFLMLFIASPYDSEEDAPPYLSWLFEPDCMDVIWYLLGITFSVPRPNYFSKEQQSFRRTDPPITPYRLLVSFSVVVFGVTKASFGYLGASTAATWTDWVFGVVATSIFYCLGLYENNSLNLWPAFFADDQRHQLHQASTATAYTAGIVVSLTWILYWKSVLQSTWLDKSLTPSTGKPDGHHPFLENMFAIAIKSLLLEFVTLSIALGISCLALALYLFAISGILRILAVPFRAIFTRIFGGVLPLFYDDSVSSLTGIPNRHIKRIATFFRVWIHIAVHLWGLAVCLTISVIVSGVVYILFVTLSALDNFFFMILFGFVGVYITAIAVMLWITNVLIVLSMVSPVFKDDYDLFRMSLFST